MSVEMREPYVSGFLAFRECGHLMELLRRLRERSAELMPQIILVDGNGVLHPRRMGLASQFGRIFKVNSR